MPPWDPARPSLHRPSGPPTLRPPGLESGTTASMVIAKALVVQIEVPGNTPLSAASAVSTNSLRVSCPSFAFASASASSCACSRSCSSSASTSRGSAESNARAISAAGTPSSTALRRSSDNFAAAEAAVRLTPPLSQRRRRQRQGRRLAVVVADCLLKRETVQVWAELSCQAADRALPNPKCLLQPPPGATAAAEGSSKVGSKPSKSSRFDVCRADDRFLDRFAPCHQIQRSAHGGMCGERGADRRSKLTDGAAACV